MWQLINNIDVRNKMVQILGISDVADFDAVDAGYNTNLMGFNNVSILAIKKDGSVWCSSINKPECKVCCRKPGAKR